MDYNGRTFDAAYNFFQANPDFTVADLNTILEKCLPPAQEPASTEGTDPFWHARKGKDMSFLTHQQVAKLKGPIDVAFIDADKRGYVDYLTNSCHSSGRVV